MVPPHLGIKNLLWVFGFAILLGVAFLNLTGPDAQQPKCNGQVMSPGDTCIVTDSSGSHTDTYEERVAQANASPIFGILAGIGALLLFGVGIWMIISYRRKVAAYDAYTAERRRQDQSSQGSWPRT